jgi:DNA-binding IscR family transcriptional regulator
MTEDAEQAAPPVSLDYAAPAPELRDYLSVFYEFRADLPVFEDQERADFAQFRFLLAGEGTYRFADGHEQAAPPISIVGPTTGNTHVHVVGPVHLFGAGLLPAGWGALIGFEASTLVNRAVDATHLFGNGLNDVMAELRAAPTLEAKVVIGNRVMHALAQRIGETPLWFTRVVDEWLAASMSPQVGDLMRLSSLADYAVVMMAAAARHCGACVRLNATLLACEETGLPLPTVQKLVSKLSAAGLIEARAAPAAASASPVRPRRSAVADIVEAVEGPIALTCVRRSMAVMTAQTAKPCAVKPHMNIANPNGPRRAGRGQHRQSADRVPASRTGVTWPRRMPRRSPPPNKKYEWGFSSDIEQEFAPKGLSEDTVRFISAKKNEPEWMLEWR